MQTVDDAKTDGLDITKFHRTARFRSYAGLFERRLAAGGFPVISADQQQKARHRVFAQFSSPNLVNDLASFALELCRAQVQGSLLVLTERKGYCLYKMLIVLGVPLSFEGTVNDRDYSGLTEKLKKYRSVIYVDEVIRLGRSIRDQQVVFDRCRPDNNLELKFLCIYESAMVPLSLRSKIVSVRLADMNEIDELGATLLFAYSVAPIHFSSEFPVVEKSAVETSVLDSNTLPGWCCLEVTTSLQEGLGVRQWLAFPDQEQRRLLAGRIGAIPGLLEIVKIRILSDRDGVVQILSKVTFAGLGPQTLTDLYERRVEETSPDSPSNLEQLRSVQKAASQTLLRQFLDKICPLPEVGNPTEPRKQRGVLSPAMLSSVGASEEPANQLANELDSLTLALNARDRTLVEIIQLVADLFYASFSSSGELSLRRGEGFAGQTDKPSPALNSFSWMQISKRLENYMSDATKAVPEWSKVADLLSPQDLTTIVLDVLHDMGLVVPEPMELGVGSSKVVQRRYRFGEDAELARLRATQAWHLMNGLTFGLGGNGLSVPTVAIKEALTLWFFPGPELLIGSARTSYDLSDMLPKAIVWTALETVERLVNMGVLLADPQTDGFLSIGSPCSSIPSYVMDYAYHIGICVGLLHKQGISALGGPEMDDDRYLSILEYDSRNRTELLRAWRELWASLPNHKSLNEPVAG